ncbi:hypothetical protein AC623_15790 [Bacillus sp. FJAT-27231]|nr:hypothetical protein AC623_15790 [Bacillus sp. FJAT-27231]
MLVQRRMDWTASHEIKETRRAKRLDVDLSQEEAGSPLAVKRLQLDNKKSGRCLFSAIADWSSR